MNELRRMAYLDAMGIDSYVSRGQLPGAAVTRRLAILRSQATVPITTTPEAEFAPQAGAIQMPRVDGASRKAHTKAPAKPVAAPDAVGTAAVPRFSLAAIVSGDWLWLEDLDGRPLAREQVQLIQGMSRALARIVPPAADRNQRQPIVAQFDWPIHNNQQLDQGEEAARAGAAGFIGRKLEQHPCRGLILLGAHTRERIMTDTFGQLPVGSAPDTASMLSDPTLKKQAWAALLSLAARL